MSYCVSCGVELHPTAEACALCRTPVVNPNQPVDREGATPFPSARGEVGPASRKEIIILLSVVLLLVSVGCALLDYLTPAAPFLALYVIGAAGMLWVWLVLPLLLRRLPLYLALFLDACAAGVYVYLIALDLDGMDWYFGLALPIVMLAAAILLGLGFLLRGGLRSLLSCAALSIGSIGLFLFGTEYFIDRFFTGVWEPRWSLIAAIICLALVVVLVVVRHTPPLREEARRRFHL